MVGTMKSKQGNSKGLSQRLKEDRISQLPDPLICQILSHLSTREAVKTSVLSTTWRSLWLWVPSLELNSRRFQDINEFLSFGDRFFDSGRVSRMNTLILTFGKNASRVDDKSYFTAWISAAIKRKIQHLHVRWSTDIYLKRNPLRLYSCETLVYLRLYEVILDDDVFVVLPRLKTMYLEKNCYRSEATVEKLVSSCPVLEKLKIVAGYRDTKVYRVHSRSLKRLSIERNSLVFYESVPGVVIDAPLLCCLNIDDRESESFIVNNMESNAKLDISLNFGLGRFDFRTKVSSRRSIIRNFLSGVSRVGDMTICPLTFKLICLYSELESLPQFGYLSCLCVSLIRPNLKWFITFLESCRNLKSLVLEEVKCDSQHEIPSDEEINQISILAAPECLLSSLEYVDFRVPICGGAAEMKLLIYLLENSAILKILTLRRLKSCSRKDEIIKKLLEIPRGYTKCEVVIL